MGLQIETLQIICRELNAFLDESIKEDIRENDYNDNLNRKTISCLKEFIGDALERKVGDDDSLGEIIINGLGAEYATQFAIQLTGQLLADGLLKLTTDFPGPGGELGKVENMFCPHVICVGDNDDTLMAFGYPGDITIAKYSECANYKKPNLES